MSTRLNIVSMSIIAFYYNCLYNQEKVMLTHAINEMLNCFAEKEDGYISKKISVK